MNKKAFNIKVNSEKIFNLKYFLYETENNSFQQDNYFLYLHGLPGDPLNELTFLPSLLAKNGFNTIVFNYPGTWGSEGTFSEADLISSIICIIDHLISLHKNVSMINLFGDSFGGTLALQLLGRSQKETIIPLKINKIVLKSPLLDIKPILPFLPTTLHYLKQAGIIRVSDVKELLKEVKKINPTQFFSIIDEQQVTKIWGVIGKNDEVLPAEEMIKSIQNFPSIHVELWKNFPHNSIDDKIYEKFFTKMVEFMK